MKPNPWKLAGNRAKRAALASEKVSRPSFSRVADSRSALAAELKPSFRVARRDRTHRDARPLRTPERRRHGVHMTVASGGFRDYHRSNHLVASWRLPMDTDRIEKKIVLKASRERVWQAISDAVRFGAWFGVEFDGPFVAGSRLTGRIVPTKV